MSEDLKRNIVHGGEVVDSLSKMLRPFVIVAGIMWFAFGFSAKVESLAENSLAMTSEMRKMREELNDFGTTFAVNAHKYQTLERDNARLEKKVELMEQRLDSVERKK